MFRRKEKQSLLETRTKSLKEAQEKVEELTFENKELKQLRKETEHNNTVILKKNRELNKVLKDIDNIANSNTYNNEKAVLSKIKELVRDYQSKN